MFQMEIFSLEPLARKPLNKSGAWLGYSVSEIVDRDYGPTEFFVNGVPANGRNQRVLRLVQLLVR